MGRSRLYKILKEWTNELSKLINTSNIILMIKLEFRHAPGTDGSGCYRNHNSIAVFTIITIFVSMKSVLINLSVDIQHNLLILKIRRKLRVSTNFWDNPRIYKLYIYKIHITWSNSHDLIHLSLIHMNWNLTYYILIDRLISDIFAFYYLYIHFKLFLSECHAWFYFYRLGKAAKTLE